MARSARELPRTPRDLGSQGARRLQPRRGAGAVTAGRYLQPIEQRLPLRTILDDVMRIHLLQAHSELRGPDVNLRVTQRRHDRNAEGVQKSQQRLRAQGSAAYAIGDNPYRIFAAW